MQESLIIYHRTDSFLTWAQLAWSPLVQELCNYLFLDWSLDSKRPKREATWLFWDKIWSKSYLSCLFIKIIFFFFARSKEVKASDSSSWKKEWCSQRRKQGFWWESFCNTNLSKVLTGPHFYQTSSPDGNVELLFFLKLNNLGKHPVQGCCLRNVCKFTWLNF